MSNPAEPWGCATLISACNSVAFPVEFHQTRRRPCRLVEITKHIEGIESTVYTGEPMGAMLDCIGYVAGERFFTVLKSMSVLATP